MGHAGLNDCVDSWRHVSQWHVVHHKVCSDAHTLSRCAFCSLLCRTFDSSLAEVCYEEGVGLLAYSPLAMGLLTVRVHLVVNSNPTCDCTHV